MSMRAAINRLLSKYIKIGNLYYKQNIEEDLLQEADLLYDGIIDQYKFSGLFLFQKDLEKLLIMHGILPQDFSLQATRLSNSIRLEQIKLFHGFDNPVTKAQSKRQLVALRRKLSELEKPLNSYHHTTLEGYADFCRFNFILGESLYNKRKRRVRVPSDTFLQVSRKINSLFVQPRLLAKDPEWRIIWQIEKVRIFRYRPLNSIQRSVVQYSLMYDSIYKHPDKPAEIIMADDDALDGWMHNQSNKNKNKSAPVSSKVNRHKNVITIVGNQDEANEVYLSNEQGALKDLGVIKNVSR